MKFVDLFAGMGGFHRALTGLGHECVFASEIDEELQELYRANYPKARRVVYGDIRTAKSKVPKHDILCAGFPCQPFSKSGNQNGQKDRTRGTLFHEVLAVLETHKPPFVILENVGNFERHNRGRTWATVAATLAALDYDVRGTVHIRSQGHGLLSPHHFGYPHHRERFFVVASLTSLCADPFPRGDRGCVTTLADVVQLPSDLTPQDRAETALTPQQVGCIEHWNQLLRRIPDDLALPSFPIWGDESGARYPFEDRTPYVTGIRQLKALIAGAANARVVDRSDVLGLLPAYARTAAARFPDWKINFIRQNRAWFEQIGPYVPPTWASRLKAFPPSLRKLEWNCKGEERDLWKHVLQFRPSGLRVKRYSSSPALVAMTTTQIPILGPQRRFLSRIEGLRLQGFPESHKLPASRARAFAALGNAVHVALVRRIALSFLGRG